MNQQNFVKGGNAPDGIHDKVEFNEWHCPSYWMWQRARRALLEHIAPVGIVVLFFIALLFTGLIEVCF